MQPGLSDAFPPAATREGAGACAYQVMEGAASCCGGGGASEGCGRVSPAAACGGPRNPWKSVLCRAFPPLPGLKSSNNHPALMPELPFSRHTLSLHPEPSRCPLPRPLRGTAQCLSLASSRSLASTQTQLECFQRMLRCKGLLDGGGRRRGQLLHTLSWKQSWGTSFHYC